MPGGWVGSTRRARLPADWHIITARILARDGYQCTAPMSDGTRCAEPASDVDHVVRGDDHSDANLRSLCGWHHKRKTAMEGNGARLAPPTNKRPAERHPGLR